MLGFSLILYFQLENLFKLKLLYLQHMTIIQVLPWPLFLWRPSLRLRTMFQVPVPRDCGLHLRPGGHGGVTGGELQGAVLRPGHRGGGGRLPAVSGGEHSRLLPGSLWSWVLVLQQSSSGEVETVCGV